MRLDQPSGALALFSESPITDVRQWFDGVLGVVGPVAPVSVARTWQPDDSWKRLLASGQEKERVTPPVVMQIEEPVTDAALVRTIASGCCIVIDCGSASALIDRLRDGVTRDISPEVRGAFQFSTVVVRIGEHDIYECGIHPHAFYYSRATMSVQIYGVGDPVDLTETKFAIRALPEVAEARQQLRPIVGENHRAMFWMGAARSSARADGGEPA